MGIAYSILFYPYIIPVVLSGLFWSMVGYHELYPWAFLQNLYLYYRGVTWQKNIFVAYSNDAQKYIDILATLNTTLFPYEWYNVEDTGC